VDSTYRASRVRSVAIYAAPGGWVPGVAGVASARGVDSSRRGTPVTQLAAVREACVISRECACAERVGSVQHVP